MFLKSLTLENFACFPELVLSFEAEPSGSATEAGATICQEEIRQWTVLVGPNGSGKTALLEAIALVTAGSQSLPDLLGSRPGRWVRAGKRVGRMQAVLQNKAGEERRVALEIRPEWSAARCVRQNTSGLAELDEALVHSSKNYFVIGYGATRRLDPGLKKSSRSVSGGEPFRTLRVKTLFDPTAVLNPVEWWAMELDRKKNAEGLKVVTDTLNSFLRGVEFDRIDRRSKQLIFRTPDGKAPLRSLGLGHQTIAAWVGDLLYQVTSAFRHYSQPLSTRGLLLVDELDLHLHPQWQRDLIDFLGRNLPNFQLVVTTHSPITAQQTGRGELHVLHRVDGTPRLTPFPGDPRRLLLHQLVTSDAFGVGSDESVAVESLKADYRSLRDKSQLTSMESERLTTLRAQIEGLPQPTRPNAMLGEGTLTDLQQAYRELTGKTL